MDKVPEGGAQASANAGSAAKEAADALVANFDPSIKLNQALGQVAALEKVPADVATDIGQTMAGVFKEMLQEFSSRVLQVDSSASTSSRPRWSLSSLSTNRPFSTLADQFFGSHTEVVWASRRLGPTTIELPSLNGSACPRVMASGEEKLR